MSRLLALAGVTLVVAACGGSHHVATMAQVKTAFARQGQPLHLVKDNGTEPSWWPHVQGVLVNDHDFAKTFSELQVLVFDSEANAKEAQLASRFFAEHPPSKKVTGTSVTTSGFVHRQGNLITIGGYNRWRATRAALATLR